MKTKLFLINLMMICSVVMKPNTAFDIIAINLERNPNRKEHLNKMLSFANCNYKIFNAVDGKAVLTGSKDISSYSNGLEMDHLVTKHFHVKKKFYGAVGLKLTDYIIMREIENSKSEKPVLILEDDVDLEADFVEKVESSLAKMNEYWDIILLSSVYYNDDSRPFNEVTGLKGIEFFTGTYAFLVNGWRTAKKLADFIENCPPKNPIDFQFGNLSGAKEIIAFAVHPRLATHLGNVFTSNIATSAFIVPDEMQNSLYEKVKNLKKINVE